MAHLDYPRHFLLLTGLGAWLAVITRLPAFTNPDASFALYGALHASALVLSLRAPGLKLRRYLFIAVGACLCVMTLHIGMLTMHEVGALSGTTALCTTLGLSALIGAWTYGIAIRLFGFYKLTPAMLALISIGCALATCAAFFVLARFPSLGRWWLPIPWWYALSGGLWYCDRHPSFQGLSGERTCSGRTPSPKI
jgi:hypothetical protein